MAAKTVEKGTKESKAMEMEGGSRKKGSISNTCRSSNWIGLSTPVAYSRKMSERERERPNRIEIKTRSIQTELLFSQQNACEYEHERDWDRTNETNNIYVDFPFSNYIDIIIDLRE